MSPLGRATLVAACLLAVLPLRSQAQTTAASYAGGLSAGRAFVIDTDDPDPPGASSFSASFERRRAGRALSLGIEGGLHRHLVIAQDISDFTGWSSRLEDRRQSWRLTPYLRWRTQGEVSVYTQVGAGLYVQRTTYVQQERESGELTIDQSYRLTDAAAGLNLGIGLDMFIPGTPVGIGLGFRTHVVGGGGGFNSAEIGIVWRAGQRRTR